MWTFVRSIFSFADGGKSWVVLFLINFGILALIGNFVISRISNLKEQLSFAINENHKLSNALEAEIATRNTLSGTLAKCYESKTRLAEDMAKIDIIMNSFPTDKEASPDEPITDEQMRLGINFLNDVYGVQQATEGSCSADTNKDSKTSAP